MRVEFHVAGKGYFAWKLKVARQTCPKVKGTMSEGKSILIYQTVFVDKHIAVRRLGFDSASRRLALAIDENHENVGWYSITAIFGSGNSASLEYDGDNPLRDKRPILQAPKQYDTLTEIIVVQGRRPVVAAYVPPVECEQYKKLKSQYESAQQDWAYCAYPENRQLLRVSNHKAKQMAREATGKMHDIHQQIQWHRQSCDTCRGVTVPTN